MHPTYVPEPDNSSTLLSDTVLRDGWGLHNQSIVRVVLVALLLSAVGSTFLAAAVAIVGLAVAAESRTEALGAAKAEQLVVSMVDIEASTAAAPSAAVREGWTAL